MSISERVRIHDVTLLSDNWYILKKSRFSFLRSDGRWQEQTRETYDRGNGAVILLFDPARRTILLVRQFRFPAFVNGYDDLLIEAPAGLLDARDPAEAIRAEVAEETGFAIGAVRQVFEAYMSPGSVTEKLYFFVAEYAPKDRVSAGGGSAAEGEDIDVLEVDIDEALAMVDDGRICDGKTIMLVQHAALTLFRD
ncbi:NUDIX domain-containing protein [Sphingosinicella sp. BN140058]|uniref:NUDIX domain-containing protein n=1 Tax=Sphingosinicella sp. BN140058 TaxID=1892855 RepID=UPI0010123F49|nr:NUDIX domain-containing protein [Sphingosinicella sp. BN140058]QAY76978.1 NUDIX domain-containing protein [Sphingosinicella sp. BN140058]